LVDVDAVIFFGAGSDQKRSCVSNAARDIEYRFSTGVSRSKPVAFHMVSFYAFAGTSRDEKFSRKFRRDSR
jgi:hypothetical protein